MLAGAICKVVIIWWRQDRSRGLFAWVKTPGFNKRLLSSWLDTVLDLTGSVDGESADEGEQRLGDVLDYGGACALAGFSLLPFLMHHSCKFVAFSRLICLHFRWFVVKEEMGRKVSGRVGGVNVVNDPGQFDESIFHGTAPKQ